MTWAESALADLRDLGAALTDAGVDWWLTDGTLLGFHRDRAFIPHDTDLDLGVLDSTWTAAADTQLTRAGFQVRRWYGAEGCAFHQVTRDGVYADLFRFYPAPRGLYHSCFICFDYATGLARRVDFHYPPFRTHATDWDGVTVRIPTNTSQYLAAKYGHDWRTPKHGDQWDHIGDCTNVTYTDEYHPFTDGPARTLTED
jgi:hypothetical protein